ncbi:aromatic hydrocarbon degradation protein [Vibrio caribbeanicus]|uniref:Aromatic hydrocarbon degradation protein n=1 Tax=Vibrio caribbeanicus TaxID=701175 RepID=A0ACC4NX83_9VIBR|nr:outer membrane protein transport protein [Vibrio caribbeanicus]KHD24964.1 aromatic hydrocarbon degradation protein [Vibrio caribbeanicus]
MNKTRLFKKSLLAVTITTATLASQQALAAGFQLNAQSATGIGRAFAGDAVIADNASVMARNPAAMALFDKTELSLGFESITSMIEVKDATYTTLLVDANGNPVGFPPSQSNADYDDAGDTSIAPNIHLIVPVNDTFAWGINAYTNFGTKTEFSDDYVAGEYGGLTDVKSMNIGLAGSVRVNEQWSFGAGLDIIYGQGKLERSLASGTELLSADANGWGLGFNVGTVFELNENNRFGLAYHYSPNLQAKGDINYAGYTESNSAISDTLYMPLPDLLELSGYHRIEDTKFAVHYSVQYIGWSSFDKLEADKSGVLNNYDWQNGMHYAIGGTYYLNNDWTLRTGYMYDTSAQDELTSISVPDSDRQWFSAGFTYHLDSKSNIDFGFTYLMGKDVDVKETKALPTPTQGVYLATQVEATTHADAILLGLQYSRSF